MDNKYKAIELSDEELAQVSGGARGIVVSDGLDIGDFVIDIGGLGDTVSDGKCGQTVNLNLTGKCTSLYSSQCDGCRYKDDVSCK